MALVRSPNVCAGVWALVWVYVSVCFRDTGKEGKCAVDQGGVLEGGALSPTSSLCLAHQSPQQMLVPILPSLSVPHKWELSVWVEQNINIRVGNQPIKM